MYTETRKLYKINKKRMQLKIIYVMEIKGELYNHHIVFPTVEHSRPIDIHWKKFVNNLYVENQAQLYIGKLRNVQW